MEIAKLSTKGQIVIPEKLRTGLQEGAAFEVRRKKDLIVLKRLKGLSQAEIKEMQELEEIWREVDEGKCKSYTVEEFFAAMKRW